MQSAELARPWIRGTCDYVTPDDASTCVPGQRRGVWRRVRSAARCLQQCEACAACHTISYFGGDSECAWFAECDLATLKVLSTQWRWTLPVRGNGSALLSGRAAALPPLPPGLPEDGTQGYAPYFYKMDEPVRVRRTISYGRGFQLLRSRGAYSEADGPCDPPQRASSCACSDSPAWPADPTAAADEPMPACVASAACGAGYDTAPAARVPAALRAAIVMVLDVSAADVRFSFGGSVHKAYAWQLRYLVRLCLSLRAANSSLPLRLLASGQRWPQALETAALPPVQVPAWASKWARSSFYRLRALCLAQLDRVLLLDTDALALASPDHLLALPPPAAVFGWKCFPRRELRASTLLLAPSPRLWRRAQELMAAPPPALYDDLGEQAVWRALLPSAHELPAGYAALRTADLSAAEWRRARVLHDPHLLHAFHRAGWEGARMEGVLERFDAAAEREMAQIFSPLLQQPAAKARGGKRGGKGRGRSKGRGKRRRGRKGARR